MAAAQARAAAIRPVLVELAAKSTRQIAAELTARGIEAPRGGRWQAQSVVNLQRHLGMAVWSLRLTLAMMASFDAITSPAPALSLIGQAVHSPTAEEPVGRIGHLGSTHPIKLTTTIRPFNRFFCCECYIAAFGVGATPKLAAKVARVEPGLMCGRRWFPPTSQSSHIGPIRSVRTCHSATLYYLGLNSFNVMSRNVGASRIPHSAS
jgi:hypothetical protein